MWSANNCQPGSIFAPTGDEKFSERCLICMAPFEPDSWAEFVQAASSS